MIHMVAILADPADFSDAEDILMDAMRETVKEIEQDFNKTTRTWKRRPKFTKTVKRTGAGIEGEVFTLDDIYRYVSEGTRIRYATMTPDFIAKTVTGWVGSRPGRGGLLYVNKNRPRPGIKAREFPEAIAEKQFPYFIRRGEVAMQRVAQSTGHAA